MDLIYDLRVREALCQQRELYKKTGIDVVTCLELPNRSKMPWTHKEPLQCHLLGALA